MTPLLPAFTSARFADIAQARDRVYCCDALALLRSLPDASVNCIVTSPPYYGLRSYTDGDDREIGKEETPAAYVERLRVLFAEARRVLRDDGVLWLNLGDSYGHGTSAARKPSRTSTKISTEQHEAQGARHGGDAKQLIGIPWRVAFALQDDGWILRSDCIWHKPNPMPESVTDRPTKSHEYVFLFAKSLRYWYDADAIKEPAIEGTDLGLLRGRNTGVDDRVAWHAPSIKRRQDAGVDSRTAGSGTRNARTVWTIATQPNSLAHFAMMPPELARRCILAGCPKGGIILDPFMGAGTTAIEAHKLNRYYIGSELNPTNVTLTNNRLHLGDETTKAIERGEPTTLPLFEGAV